MSDSHHPPSLSGSKRAASPTAAAAEMPAQRQRLASPSAAATLDPPSAARPPLSAAQRCADDALTIIFGFVDWKDLFCVARTCRAWLAAAAKGKPRGRTFCRDDRLAALCASSSPFRRHISRITGDGRISLSLEQLAQLRQMSELTALEVQLDAAELIRLMDAQGGGALAKLKTAFPPNLQQLTLLVPTAYSTAACQLLLDALPAMEGLEQLSLWSSDSHWTAHNDSTSLSLEPLLQLPHLTDFEWQLDQLTVPQLLVIKQVDSLQHFDPGQTQWAAEELAAFCRPPHRLQQLEEMEMGEISANAEVMAELVHLSALTSMETMFLPDAITFLPRFPRLQRLDVSIDSGDDDDQQADSKALLVSALSACPALTHLTLSLDECSESFGTQLVQAVPQLRSLSFQYCSLPSLRFLRHAPHLENLSLSSCKDVRPGHVFGLGSFAPQLQSLRLGMCAGLLLDEDERRLLTPPGAMRLPHLCWFHYSASH